MALPLISIVFGLLKLLLLWDLFGNVSFNSTYSRLSLIRISLVYFSDLASRQVVSEVTDFLNNSTATLGNETRQIIDG